MVAALDGLLWEHVSVCSTGTGQKLIRMWNIQSFAAMSGTDEEIVEVDVKMDDSEVPPNCDLKGAL